jgi:putative transferase (TIGR04331 family)
MHNINDISISTSKKYKYYLFINKIYEKYLKEISIILNNIHNVNHSKEYWRIIIGPWLIISISNIFYTLKFHKLKKKNLKKNRYLNSNKTPNDHLDFTKKIKNEPNWMLCLQSEIFNVNKKKEGKKNLTKNIKNISSYSNFKQRLSFKQKIIFNIQKLLNFLLIKKNTIYWHSYFSFFKLLKNSLKNKSFNIFDQYNFIFPKFKYQKQYRTWNISEKNKFEKILNNILPKICPKTYLEGFQCIIKKQKKLFPNRLDSITTGVSYVSDDFFKILAAEKKLTGTKLYINQHGAQFFKYDPFYIHVGKISDIFFSWGRGKKNIGNKNIGKKIKTKVIGYPKKEIIINDQKKNYFAFISINTIGKTVTRYNSHMLTHTEYNKYLKNIKKFLDQLPKEIRKKIALAIKEEPDSIKIAKKIFKKDFPEMDLYINSGFHLSKISKMHISTWANTLELETININIPTLFVIADEKYELFGDYKKIFFDMKKSGYYFTNLYNAANAILKIYNNFEKFKLVFLVNNSVKKFKNCFLNK